MQRIVFLSFFLLGFFSLAFPQTPQGFNYQAVARDASGHPITGTTIPVTITIQSDSLGGTIFWEELHATVKTDDFGVFTLVVGKGMRQPVSDAENFDEINWNITPKYIKTQVFYMSELINMGSARLWSVPYALVAKDLDGPLEKLEVTGKTTLMDEALFEVKNKEGYTVFAVYNEGVRIYVGDGLDTKGAKGGFSIGGFNQTKEPGQDYFVVNSDSIRAYIDTNEEKTVKGGFSVGGFDNVKANEEYLRVTRDSTRIYINNTETKSKKGGFSVGGFANIKEDNDEYLSVTMDSVKISKSLLIPRLTTEERDNLPFTPGDALIIFNMTESCMQIYKNNVWSNIWCFNCAPAFIIQPVDQTICSGENAIFFVSATGTSLSYQWQESPDNGTSWYNIYDGGTSPVYSGCNGYTLSLANTSVNNHNFKYRCIVAGSCLPNVVSNLATLNVGSAPPVITSQPSDQQVSGDCTVIFSIVSPGHGVTYQWQESTDGGSTWNNILNGGTSPVYSGANTSILSMANVGFTSNSFKYRCIAGNSCGADVTSDAATLSVPSVSIVTHPSDQQLSSDCQATFTVAVPEGYVVSYQWQESTNGGTDWNIITDGGTSPLYSGSVSSSLILSNVPLAYNNYKYRCAVSSLCGPNETSTAAVLTITLLPEITVQPVNKRVYPGQNTFLSITTSGTGNNYHWQVSSDGGTSWSDITDGGTDPAYTGAITDNLQLTNVPLTYDNYKFHCVVSHYCRQVVTSDAITLSVPPVVQGTDYDGNTYNSVGIGSQLWMAENLKTTRYRNGDLIGTTDPATLDISAETTPEYQWAAGGDEGNVTVYGRLYTWYAANDSRDVCPTGWHLPSDAEWTTLTTYLGESNAGGKLKETGTIHWVSPNLGATNETGFTALPAGVRQNNLFIYCGDIAGFWWSSTPSPEITTPPYAYCRSMGYSNSYVDRNPVGNPEHWGFSVRCLKD